jgi:acyl carrier protein
MNVMTRAEIIEKLRELIEPYVQDPESFADLGEKTHLLEDLKVNSANLVDIIIDTEAAFDIEIDDDAAERMLTVGEAVTIVEERLTSNAD